MTIEGAIADIKSWDIPFYCEKSREKVIETIIETYTEGANSERLKAFSNGYTKGRESAFKEIAYSDDVIKEPFEKLAYEKGKADAIDGIKAEIKSMKNINSSNANHDYLTGYISALSALEGFCEIVKEHK